MVQKPACCYQTCSRPVDLFLVMLSFDQSVIGQAVTCVRFMRRNVLHRLSSSSISLFMGRGQQTNKFLVKQGCFHNIHLFSQKWTPIQYCQRNWEYAFPNRNSQQGILVFILFKKSSNFWKHCGSSSSPAHGARQMEDYFIQWNICPVIAGLRKTRREWSFERLARVRVILSHLCSVADLLWLHLGLHPGPPCCCAVRLTVIVLWGWGGTAPTSY